MDNSAHSPQPAALSTKSIRLWCKGCDAAIDIIPSITDTKQSLAQAIWLSGKLATLPLCSGLGRCGLCRVRFLSKPPNFLEAEVAILGHEALADGWRLSCRHSLESAFDGQDFLELELPNLKPYLAEKPKNIPQAIAETTPEALLAVDLGTTSLCWQALSPKGQILAEGKSLNPLMGAGADIISRLRFAMQENGAQKLAHILQEDLQKIISSLPPIKEICLAANTAMTALFLEKDIEPLAHAPYSLPLNGHSVEHITNLPPIYIPPQMAPFVGGDISAGYTALLQRNDVEYPFILADLGTNGEFILALSQEEILITSVPMGPSLEGIGLRFGHMVDGSCGIVTGVRLDPRGLHAETTGDAPAEKICGTGYLSIIHALLKLGVIGHDGTFNLNIPCKSPLQKKIMQNIRQLQEENGEHVVFLWGEASPIYIAASDIEEILKVKAAFSLAVHALLHKAELAPSALRHIYIAGAMGSHVHLQDLEALGFVPFGASKRIRVVGNSALEGACALLLKPQWRNTLQKISMHSTLVSLTEDQHFTEKFMQHMTFSYKG